MRRFVVSLAAAGIAVVALSLVLGALGHPPLRMMWRLFDGSLGSWYAASETLLKTTPLLFTALAVVIAFRAGVWNIGGEGQFVAGGVAALIAAQALPAGIAATGAALVAGAIAGALWAGVASLLRVYRNAPEVLTTILLNFVAVHLLGWLVQGPLQENAGRYPQSEPLAPAARLEGIAGTRLHAGLWIALAAAIAIHLFLFHSATGLRMRAAGLNALAARWAGVRVTRETVRAMLLSGAFAGLGGSVELLGVTHRLYERFAAGAGYSGIAVALLAQLHPLGAILSAAFFGALSGGAGALQRAEGVPAAVAVLGQGVAVLALLGLASFRILPRAGAFFRTRRGTEAP